MNTLVRTYLIELARKRTNQTVNYQKLSDDCKLGFKMENPFHRKELGLLLGDISRYEHMSERPLLSALVLRAGDNNEGDGFYKLSEELGYGKWQKLKEEGIFEIIQINKCIEFWTNDSNYKSFK
ncbi:hypothetical protein ASG38_12225 [Flavobacterium sp. Leaf359]|uniref:hypothetical protein n=1 Tax=Flavobacterium sp. Leaf359 TaxID=1736351 RepID=UPI0006F5BD1E|nr:hypothetical protein [Flavobacterium sp. Leaf359]KQS46554.1 hypothetical protein ASG38_12225 [Flavobacterium sp. Leaf359]